MLKLCLALLVGAGAVTLAGCTPQQYAEQADRAAYATLESAQQAALGKSAPLDVTYKPFAPSGDESALVIRIGEKIIPLRTGEPTTLTLADYLEIAIRNSRSFQTQKESLYSSALALANQRRGWSVPLFGGDVAGDAKTTYVSKEGDTSSADASAGVSLTQRLIHGGVITLAASIDLATEFLGGRETAVGSLVEANFTQPLLRGAWRGFAYEDLYRSERDFLFEVFEYERFTQTFAIGIITNYYSVLRRRDELANEAANIESLKQTVAETRVKVEGGAVSRIQLDQAEQRLLNARIRYERSQQDYQDALDDFKLTLGLPIKAGIRLDYPNALEELNIVGPKPVPFDEARAIEIAMAVRPDVLTERARVRDAGRDLEIAADQFLPQLDVTVGISAAGTEPRDFYRVQFHRDTRFALVNFNYDLDQTDNRDAYRRALIDLAKVRRDFEEFVDEVSLDVRKSYRSLTQASRSYELQLDNVKIARRQVRLAELQQREGEASARDVLEAKEDLRDAQNGLTSSLVSYTTTRLSFLATLGMIWVDEKGMFHERTEPFTFQRIKRRYDEAPEATNR